MEWKFLLASIIIILILLWACYKLFAKLLIAQKREEGFEKQIKILTKENKKMARKLNEIPTQYGGTGKSELQLYSEHLAKRRKENAKKENKRRKTRRKS